MLDEFSSVKLDAQKPAEAPKAATAQPAPESKDSAPKADAPFGTDGDFSEEEFAKQLQAGMADLLGEFEKSVSLPAPSPRHSNVRITDRPTARHAVTV